MKLIIYKITMNDDKCYYTDSREDLVSYVNNYYKDDATFKQYTISTINGILYNKYENARGIKSIEKFDANEYYKNYLDIYINNLNEKAKAKNKTYSDGTIKRFKYHYITLLNTIEFEARNNGDNDDIVKQKINTIGLIKV